MADEIQLIVDQLNQPPFNKDRNIFTLVSFDELKPQELLQLFNDVLGTISKIHVKDLRDEPPDFTIQRWRYFLWELQYEQLAYVDFNALKRGDRNAVYPVLGWCLKDWKKLQKKAYLARYLAPFDVPQELFSDQEMVDVYQQYKDLQQELIEVHKVVDKLRESSLSPDELKKQMDQMETDKQTVNVKIERIRTRVTKDNIPDYDELMQVIPLLRREIEEAKKLQERHKDQQHQLLAADQKHLTIYQRWKEVKANSQDNVSAKVLLERLEEDMKMNKFLAEEKLPKDIEDRKKRLDNVERVAAVQIDEQYLMSLTREIKSLHFQINSLNEKKQKQQDQPNDALSMFRQQLNLVASKKKVVLEKLNQLMDQKRQLEREIMEKEEQCQGFTRGAVPKAEEFNRLQTSVKTKAVTMKKHKSKLSDIRAEKGILDRTCEVLKTRDSNIQEFLRDLEAKKGITGYSVAAEQLETVSAQKAEVDEFKGKTLEEVSEFVKQINEKIEKNKKTLAPQIKELRTLRAQVQEVETEYNEKKTLYESTSAGLESEAQRLESELHALREESKREESTFHYLHCLTTIVDVNKLRVAEEEKRAPGDKPTGKGEGMKSSKDMYTQRLQHLEAHSKALRDRQKMIKESHETNMVQLSQFNDLKKLLDCKIRSYKHVDGDTGMPIAANPNMNGGGMGISVGPVDILQLDNLDQAY